MRHMKWIALVVALALPSETLADAPDGAKANTPPEDLVSLALKAEVRGDRSAREALLNEALSAAPDDAAARWHSGHVRVGDAWVKPETVAAQAKTDHRLVEYQNVRDKYAETAEGQLELASWCARKGLHDQKRAHLTKVLEVNPNHAGTGSASWEAVGVDFRRGGGGRQRFGGKLVCAVPGRECRTIAIPISHIYYAR